MLVQYLLQQQLAYTATTNSCFFFLFWSPPATNLPMHTTRKPLLTMRELARGDSRPAKKSEGIVSDRSTEPPAPFAVAGVSAAAVPAGAPPLAPPLAPPPPAPAPAPFSCLHGFEFPVKCQVRGPRKRSAMELYLRGTQVGDGTAGTVGYGTVRCSKVSYGMVEYGTIRHRTARHGTSRHVTSRQGAKRYGIAR